jgi:hypothetical protein
VVLSRRSALLIPVLGAASALLSPAFAQSAGTAPSPVASWPHSMTVHGATITIYEPQAIEWPDRTMLRARAAISITPPGATQAIIGTIEFQGATQVDLDTQLVTFSSPTVLSSKFPSLDTDQAVQLEARIKAFVSTMPVKEVPLNTILLSLNEKPVDVPVDNTPPQIFYSARPASLVVFDGSPTLAPIGSTGLSFAVNTNWDVVYDADAGGTWYLLNNGSWLIAPAATGPYEPAGALPAAFSQIPSDENFATLRKNVPGRPFTGTSIPTIFVSTKPAEIIVTAGAPAFKPIPGTALQAVTNTGATLIKDTADGNLYYLVSGRWFSAPSLYGPWTFATPNLPTDFSLLPPDSAYGNLLPSVPGTAAAQAAVLKAQIPVQASLSRQTAKVTVTYVGAPQFKPIPGTALQYAVNTTFQVIQTGGRYYVCYQGAWFTSASPTGPWVLASSVPNEIYTIPPSSPLYNVTYVKVYSSTPAAVTYGYTAGYLMGFVTAGVLAYGTGYYYPPVVVAARIPAYLPYPYSYGGNVYYSSATGTWARGGTVYGPYGRAATGGTAYNPATGAYARGGAVYGPYGGAGAWSAYNPSTGTYAHGSAAWNGSSGTAHASFANPRYGVAGSTTQNANAYGRWGSSTVSGPNGTVNTASASNSRGSAGAFNASNGAQGAAVHGANGNNAAVVKGSGGNVYAGANGNAYKKTNSGWQTYNNGSWQSVNTPKTNSTATRSQTTQRSTTYNQTSTSARQYHAQAPATRQNYASTASRPTMGTQEYGQLNRDYQARQFGGGYNRGGGGYGGGGARRRW